jgi:Zn-dependent protease with chaperone function
VIYTNLLVFITAIFLFSIAPVPEVPPLGFLSSLVLTATILCLYGYLAHRVFRKHMYRSAGGYFQAEKKLSILALAFFSVVLFFGEFKYHLSVFSFGDRVPALVNFAGLALFFLFLCLMWLAARPSYSAVFGRVSTRRQFLFANIRTNLPIVLPWVVLSLVYDLLSMFPGSGLETILESTWGDILFFGLFLVFVVLFFPPLVRILWNCQKLPDSPLKQHLVEFCRRQDFEAELYVWPLYEGRVLTAGVMGLVPGLRYILLTPAIMEALSMEELEAVMAHEIGHVKKKHLLLYVLLIGGFSVLAGFLVEPFIYLFLSMDWVFTLLGREDMDPETLFSIISGVPILIMLLLYFRYVFGYFIRNFERQADLYVFKVLDNSRWLVSAFHKITLTSGQSAEQKNWHHFGIAERIDYLERCERQPALIARQDRKVRNSLFAYLLILGLTIGLVQQVPTEQLARNYEIKYIEKVLMPTVIDIENKALWFFALGDLLFSKNLENRALFAYNQALELEPDNPEILNNLAWLLLTSQDTGLRDPERALDLARVAVETLPRPHVLDTLATAYWANGFVEEALRLEREALDGDPSQADFYRRQIERFTTERYHPDTTILN